MEKWMRGGGSGGGWVGGFIYNGWLPENENWLFFISPVVVKEAPVTTRAMSPGQTMFPWQRKFALSSWFVLSFAMGSGSLCKDTQLSPPEQSIHIRAARERCCAAKQFICLVTIRSFHFNSSHINAYLLVINFLIPHQTLTGRTKIVLSRCCATRVEPLTFKSRNVWALPRLSGGKCFSKSRKKKKKGTEELWVVLKNKECTG